MSASWQVSASYMRSMVTALRALGQLPRARELVTPATRAMLDAPHAQSWWDGEVLVDVLSALGAQAAREVSLRASRDGMGPLVKPLASVLLALTKSPPRALLSRLDAFVGAGVKGVEARFVPNARDDGGVVSFTFPRPVPAEVAAVWAGLFDVGFGMARSGRVVQETIEPQTHRYDVAW